MTPATATLAAKPARQPKPLPAPNSDFYELYETLSAEELAIVKRVRTFMETKVAPVITKYWVEDAFPFELLPACEGARVLAALAMHGYGCAGGSLALVGFVADGDGARRSVVRDLLSACTTGWRWVPSISTDRKSRSRSGCRRWRVSRRSAVSA